MTFKLRFHILRNVTICVSLLFYFFAAYDLTNPNVFPNCDFILGPPENKTCGVDIRRFGSCSNANNFGLNDGKPCIFVKFDTKPGWIPEYYNVSELPDDMPSDLKSTIISHINGHSKNVVSNFIFYIDFLISNIFNWQQTVWISCDGVSDEDKKSVGPINILPRRGFLGFYFDETSCKSENLCTDPLVAIQFQRIEKSMIYYTFKVF